MILRAANARDEVIKLADEGRFDAAQALLAQVTNDLRAAALEAAADNVTLGSYDLSSSKNLHYESWNRRHRNRS